MNDFDDFVNISSDLEEEFLKTAKRYVKIFLEKIGAKNVEEVAVKFVKQPFLDVLIAFRINGEIVRLDDEYIKLKSLKKYYDSVLANIFSKYSYEDVEAICQKLKKEIENKYVK